LTRQVRDWDYDVLDYLRLMKAYLEQRINVKTYQQEFFAMTKKRTLVSERADSIIQKAYGDADDYDPVLGARYVDETRLRELVSKSVKELEALGSDIGDQER